MRATALRALITRLRIDLDAAQRPLARLEPAAPAQRVTVRLAQPERGRATSSAAEGTALAGEPWWKHSQSEPGQCDKRLHGGCDGDIHEQVCTDPDCAYTARRCDRHGGGTGTGQQIAAHTGRHRAERRELAQPARGGA